MKYLKNRCTITLILFLCVYSLTARAQSNAFIDSLEQQLSKHKSDTIKVNLLASLAWNYVTRDLNKAKFYNKKAALFASKLNYRGKNGALLNISGLIRLYEGKPDSAFPYFYKAEQAFIKIGDKKSLTGIYNNLAMSFAQKKDASRAIANYKKSWKIASQLRDKHLMASALSNLGAIYQDTRDPDSALWYHKQSLELKKEIKDTIGMAITYYNIGAINSDRGRPEEAIRYFTEAASRFEQQHLEGNLAQVYNSMSGVNWKIDNYRSALKYNGMALRLARKTGMDNLIPEIYFNRGLILLDQGNDKEAIRYIQLSIDKGKSTENMNVVCEALLVLGKHAQEQKQYNIAETYFIQAMDFAHRSGFTREMKLSKIARIKLKLITKDTTSLYRQISEIAIPANDTQIRIGDRDALTIRAEYAAIAGEKDTAIMYYMQLVELLDTMLNGNMLEQFAEMQTRYETEKKEKEIVLLKQQKEIDRLSLQKRKYQLAGLTTLLALLAIATIAYLRRQRLRRRMEATLRELNEQELKRKTIAETEQAERQRIAKDLHDELGSGMSKIVLSNELAKKHINGNQDLNYTLRSIDKTVQELSGNMKALIWSLNSENGTVETLLVKMREFAGDFLEESDLETTFDFPDELPQRKLSKEMLRDIFLSFKEAVNNAFKYSEGSHIMLSARLEKNRLNIRVADNGIGMQQTKRLHTGSGLLNMEERITRQGGKFTINSAPGKGTEIRFNLELPNE